MLRSLGFLRLMKQRQIVSLWHFRLATRLLCCFIIVSAFAFTFTLLHTQSAHADGPACSLTVSSATTVVTAATESAIGLEAWPDVKLGVVNNGGGSYSFFSSDGRGFQGGTKGSLDNPTAGGVVTKQSIQNLQHTYNYAGGGKIYNDTVHNTLIMLYHAETWPNGDASKFYAHLGLAKSTDGGATWNDLGEILAPHVPYTTTNPQTEDLGDGTFAVVNDAGTNYLYVYFGEPGIYVSVARAPLADVLNAAEQTPGSVVPFYKYYQGTWNEPGLGGNASETKASGGGMAYADVSYNSDIGRYIMIGFSDWPATELGMVESSDGLHWGNWQLVFAQEGDLDTYTTIVGTGSDPNLSSGSFYLYYTDRVNGWPVERRTLSCNGPASQSDAGTYDANTGFSSTQGVNRWHYESHTVINNVDTYTDLGWNSSNNWWAANGDQYLIDGSGWQEPGSSEDSALDWVAPQAGTVTITANGSINDESGGDGVNVKVLLNGTQLWPSSGWQYIAAGGSVTFPTTTATVQNGDQIHFIVNRNGNNAYDVTGWDPVISYSGSSGGPSFVNASFETPSLGTGNSAYQYQPGEANWSFDPGTGIEANGSAFLYGGGSNAPDGTQAAFIQSNSSGSNCIAQMVNNFVPGHTYSFTFSAAQRGNGQGGQSIQVYMDVTSLGGAITPNGTNYQDYTSGSVTPGTGTSHTIKFCGTVTSGDHAAFLDNIRINS